MSLTVPAYELLLDPSAIDVNADQHIHGTLVVLHYDHERLDDDDCQTSRTCVSSLLFASSQFRFLCHAPAQLCFPPNMSPFARQPGRRVPPSVGRCTVCASSMRPESASF